MSMDYLQVMIWCFGSENQRRNNDMVDHENDDLQQVIALSRKVGPLFSWCDNYDILVCTSNRHRNTHCMAIEFMWNSARVCSCLRVSFNSNALSQNQEVRLLLSWM